ncbi:MAG: Ig-like domain-containing protein, partial [Actinomycetota bacterium]
MSEIEPRLRELLEHKAGQAPAPAAGPGTRAAGEAWAAGLRLRARRRAQAGAPLGGIAAVLVAVAVLVFIHAGGPPVPAAAGPCFRAPSLTPPAPSAASNWSPITLTPSSQCFTLTADSQASNGVSPDTTFTLTSTVRTDAATLKPLLSVRPAVALTVEAVGASGQTFQIQPAKPLAATTLYRFAILNRPGGQVVQTWSFQAGGPLTVAESVPGNQATNVPLNIGVQLTMSVDGATGVQQRFSISPPVTGTFQTESRTVSFVPSSALQPATVYTVTVTAGVSVPGTSESLANDFVLQFETGTKSAQPSGGLTFVNSLWGSPTTSAPSFSLSDFAPFGPAKQPASPTSTTLSVYRFPGIDSFLGSLGALNSRPSWATMTPINYPSVTTTGLDEVEQVTAPLQPDRSALDARLPAPLPAGYYLVTAPTGATGGASPMSYSLLQVSDLSAYVTESTTKTLVWVNDLSTGKPVAGVSVRLAGTTSVLASTGADGTASFSSSVLSGPHAGPHAGPNNGASNPSNESATPQELILSGPGGTQAAVQVSNSPDLRDSTGEPTAFGNSDATAAYWQFLTTDRPLYRLSDTVQAWGVLRLRTQLSAPQKVELIITGYLYDGSPTTVAQTTVMTGPDGTYTAALSYQQANPGFYSLEALVGGQVISNTPIQIVDFVTPPYSLT